MPPLPSLSLRSAIVAFALVSSSACLNNPSKPIGELLDAGSATGDGQPAGHDGTGPADTRPATDQALTSDLPVSGDAPDGATAQDGAADTGAGVEAGPCTSVCTAGHKRCAAGGVETCAVDAGGCATWSAPVACGPNQRCSDNATDAFCVCKDPTPPCTAEGSYCRDPFTIGQCGRDAQGCLHATATANACPAGQLCGGTLGSATCGCPATCTQAQVGTYCVDGRTIATCAGSNGCFASSAPTACMGARTCQGATGSAACSCPAAGTTAGTACTMAGATACDGQSLLTCTADGTGCNTWVATTNCQMVAGGPLTCGTRGGTAACQCPDPATPDIFVDPVAGSTGSGGVTPNGAMTPPACRFRTISRALTAVSNTRRKIIAVSAQPPVTFSSETFPLTIPAGVTLGTAAATPAPASYTIQFNAATAASGVVLGAGATLEGFTVQLAGGNLNAPVVSCISGAVTVRNSHVVGGGSTKPATGVAVGRGGTDTCTGTISGAEVRGFRTGVSVATTAPDPLVIASSTLRDNGTGTTGAGLAIAGGRVTATGLTIDRTASGTASFGVLLDANGATNAPTLTATDLRVIRTSQAGLELRQAAGRAAPTATLTGGNIEAGGTTEVGLRVAAGTLVMNGVTVHDAGSDGLRVSGGTVTIGPGTHLESNGRDGVRIESGTVTGVDFFSNANAGDGITVSNGLVTLHGVTVSNNVGRGVLQSAGTLLIDDGSAIRLNGRGATKLSGLRMNGGNLTIGAATGDPVEIADNGDDGLHITPITLSTISVNRASIHGSGNDGIEVDMLVASSTVTVKDTDVYENLDGVRVIRAPVPVGAGVTLENLRIHSNGRNGAGGVGVILRTDLGDVEAIVRDSIIRNNRDHGLLVQQSSSFLVTSWIIGNDIFGNNTGAMRSAGGIFFPTASTLVEFTGNKVHGNTGDEIAFGGRPNGGGDTWTLGSALACGAATNQIYCYEGTPNQVGVRILSTAPAGTKVNAENVSWTHAGAMRGREFDFADGMSHQVSATAVCPAVTMMCN